MHKLRTYTDSQSSLKNAKQSQVISHSQNWWNLGCIDIQLNNENELVLNPNVAKYFL